MVAVVTWRDLPAAGGAFGGEVAAVAVGAHQRIAPAAEGLLRQRALAAAAAEAVGVVMPVLVEDILRRTGRTVRGGGEVSHMTHREGGGETCDANMLTRTKRASLVCLSPKERKCGLKPTQRWLLQLSHTQKSPPVS